MKKSYLILLACIGLICGIAYAQKYVVVNQGAKKTGYLLSKVDSITHTSNQVTINMAVAPPMMSSMLIALLSRPRRHRRVG